MRKPATHSGSRSIGAAYPNLEEEATIAIAIATGTIENKRWGVHGLGVRKGHDLMDTS